MSPSPEKPAAAAPGMLPSNVELDFLPNGEVRWRIISEEEVLAKRPFHKEGGIVEAMKKQADKQATASGAAERTLQNAEAARRAQNEDDQGLIK